MTSPYTDVASDIIKDIRVLCDRLEIRIAKLKEIEEDYLYVD